MTEYEKLIQALEAAIAFSVKGEAKILTEDLELLLKYMKYGWKKSEQVH